MRLYAELPARGVVRIEGPDRAAFMQGLITNNITYVEQGQAVFAALLSPQGKFLHDFFIVKWDDGYMLDCERARAFDLVQRLNKYKLRSRVTISDRSDDFRIIASWEDSPGRTLGIPESGLSLYTDGVVYGDPRMPELGVRGFIKKHAPISLILPHDQQVDALTYDAQRLRFAIPDSSRDVIPERSILLECGYDELHAIDFNKGCYVGQEVTARSKHRATLRKFLHVVQTLDRRKAPRKGQAASEAAAKAIGRNGNLYALPHSGTIITIGGREIGEMRSSLGGTGLAMLKVDDVEKALASNTPILAGELPIRAQLPNWVKTSFATDTAV